MRQMFKSEVNWSRLDGGKFILKKKKLILAAARHVYFGRKVISCTGKSQNYRQVSLSSSDSAISMLS